MWVTTATLPFTPYYDRFVLLGHNQQLSIGVIAGGAFVVAGIIRIATAVRDRRALRRCVGSLSECRPSLNATMGMTQRSSRGAEVVDCRAG